MCVVHHNYVDQSTVTHSLSSLTVYTLEIWCAVGGGGVQAPGGGHEEAARGGAQHTRGEAQVCKYVMMIAGQAYNIYIYIYI